LPLIYKPIRCIDLHNPARPWTGLIRRICAGPEEPDPATVLRLPNEAYYGKKLEQNSYDRRVGSLNKFLLGPPVVKR